MINLEKRILVKQLTIKNCPDKYFGKATLEVRNDDRLIKYSIEIYQRTDKYFYCQISKDTQIASFSASKLLDIAGTVLRSEYLEL